MTLIFEIEDTKSSSSLYISDCMVSLAGQRITQPNRFPLHVGSGWDIDTGGVDLSSKICLGNDRTILSAGLVHRIENVVPEFLSIPAKDDFRSFLDQFYENESSLDEFIYSYLVEEGVACGTTNCTSFSSGHLNFHAGGTGAAYLSSMIASQTPDENMHVLPLGAQIVAQLIRQEFVDYKFPEQAFGCLAPHVWAISV